ncbi:SusC/RagA family TonB-linked outer membrane protein [Chitinophaga pendula]|uniref:SusC/RagA family TonB-linked outer membrane protein n=1 Tax=Chitinophaga TaxID=79328 RepID=UPI000BB058C5|nr:MULTISPECIES: SusC/RagA family TonB-linked outer membrane protein [Chitinophaga]ASZ11890.1 SusC/RagA family TonB-linked outer membrane protein [Chitinophaga sp. MD30]UCJ05084.1 SusC/RagA family TonB-linked outer membrane protein [Chitinophaga pendula]
MKTYLLMLLLSLWTISASSQELLRGIVTDDTKVPLPGATIRIKGTTTGTVTQPDGSFSIRVNDPKQTTVLVNYINYLTQEIPLEGRLQLNVSLVRDPVKLKDVVVTSALGLTRKAKSVVYSSQSVDPTRLTEARDVNIANTLAGKVAGLQVTTSGQPGGSSRVIIRGDNSITGNNQPLWVIDGVPIDNPSGDGRGDNLDYGNGVSDLNPDDIESIEVLKGPNAAALYGSKAANGAILITSKKGRGRGDRSLGVSVNQNMMWNTISEFPAYQNVYGEGNAFRLVQNANNIVPGTNAINMGTNTRSWGVPMLGQPYNDYSGKPHGYLPQPNNVRDLYRSSLTNITNVAIAKSDSVSAFRLSYTYTRANDVLENQNIRNKHNLNLTASRGLGKKVNVDTRLLYTYDNMRNRTYRNMDPQSPMNAYIYLLRSIDIASLHPYRDDNGDAYAYGAQGDGYENPYWSINENENQDLHHRVIGGVTTTIDLLPDLKFRAQIAGDLAFGNGYQYREKGARQNKNGFYSNFNQQNQYWNIEGLLLYNKQLKPDFSLTASLGTNFNFGNSLFRQASVASLINHDMPSIANSNAYPRATESLVRRKVNSVFAATTLGYKDFLFLDVTGRNDWSSTLPTGNASFFYPSVGGSFVFTQFLESISNIVNYGKLRVSWAQVGNDAPAYYLQSNYQYGGLFLGTPWLDYENLLKNKNLKPEQTTSREVGLDLSLFKDRISINATVYKSNTINQIMRAQVARETGFTEQILNAGEIQNSGIELSLKATPVRTNKFTWDLLANWATNNSKVVSLTPGVNRYVLGSWWMMSSNAEVGQPYGVLRGNVAYRNQGKLIINPANGQPYYDENAYLGNFRPDWIGSFGSTFRYKGFDLSFLVTVKWGGDIYSVSNHKANVTGNTIASLEGRDAFLFSSLVLGESGDEQKGVGLYGNPYLDARNKGMRHPGYYPLLDASGKPILDKNGRYQPGAPNAHWISPQGYWQTMDFDMEHNLFNATSIRVSELVLGYSLPLSRNTRRFFQGARLALVGRNLWTILKHTPKGIDPEAANTSGNAQGIEQGGSFPYAQYGFDLKFNF